MGEELLGLDERGVVGVLVQELVDDAVLHEHARNVGEHAITITLAAVDLGRSRGRQVEEDGERSVALHEAQVEAHSAVTGIASVVLMGDGQD